MLIKRGCEIYLLVALLAATLLSPLPQSAIALALFMLRLYLYLKQPEPRWRIPIILGYLLVVPLLLAPALHLLSAVVIIPALPLISSSLRENAPNQHLISSPQPRKITTVSKSVIASTGIMILVSLLLSNWVLAISSGLVLTFIAGILIYTLRRLPLSPLEIEQKELRVIVGNTARSTTKLKNKSKLPFHISIISNYPWINIDEDRFLNLSTETEINLVITPTLSGPSRPQIEILITDLWGLIQIRQPVKPVNLYVIPRARYAEWLARKYLEETAPQAGAIAATLPTASTGIAPSKGVEYYDSRPYQAGDRLKDIDWKHTVKLQEIVVKEYMEDARQTAIITVNLTAADAEEADKLVYNLITSALTLARDTIPTAIVAYNHEQVLTASPPLDPRDAVKKTLQLGQQVVLIAPMERYLQGPDIKQIRTSLRRLERANTEPARKLKDILELEKKAIEQSAKEHPATKALNLVAAHTSPPATITVLSAYNHDNEALLVTLEKLRQQGYNTILIKIR